VTKFLIYNLAFIFKLSYLLKKNLNKDNNIQRSSLWGLRFSQMMKHH